MIEQFFNREYSLLEFHRRVLHQAQSENLPLLERLRFLCIFSTNLDEFFEVSIGGLVRQIDTGNLTPPGPDGLLPEEILDELSVRVHHLINEQYRILNEQLLPQLANYDIEILRRGQWNTQQTQYLKDYFELEVLPLLSPIGLDPTHPFPRILNKSLNFIVQLEGKDAFGRDSGQAIVQVPRSLPHLIEIPRELNGGERTFTLISSIIHYFMDKVFNGMKIVGSYQFRLTRNTDIFLNEEETEDMLRAVRGELAYRQYGDEVRLEVADNCPEGLLHFLQQRCEVPDRQLYRVNGLVNLNRLSGLFDYVKDTPLLYPPLVQTSPKVLKKKSSKYFDILKRQDVLLQHPFDAFQPVVELLHQAALDPKVLAIKQTLYRTGSNSPIVDSLVAAAKAGKEVTVIIELRARFDEEENVVLAERLQRYGVHVIYGVVGFKTHAKMMLIARRESTGLRYYVHLGTGNYHPKTASIYTDYGLMTSDKEIGEDLYKIFLQLSSMGKMPEMSALLHAPFTLHKALIKKVHREIDNAKQGKPARIVLKLNALYEKSLVSELYAASNAGVKIDLIVRGICQLVPGVKGLSENIRVRSIVGRFLEHSRIYYFYNNENPEVFCASADWMVRNMHQRVEICFPIKNKKNRERIIKELELYLIDNYQAWELQTDGAYELLQPESECEVICAQQIQLQQWSKTEIPLSMPKPLRETETAE